MANVVTKKIRCLVVGCNPKMTASGDENTSVSTWSGDKNFQKHLKEHPDHRIAKAPERSAEGQLKQKIRNQTGVYPVDLNDYNSKKQLEEELLKERQEAKRLQKIENKKKDAELKKASEIRRQQYAAQHQKELAKAKETRAKHLEKLKWMNLDKSFINECQQDISIGDSFLRTSLNFIKYGEELRLNNTNDYQVFMKLRDTLFERHHWSEEVVRGTRRVSVSYTKEEMQGRRALIKQWEKLTKKGIEEGWLEWTSDYSGSHIEPNYATLNTYKTAEKQEFANDYSDRLNSILKEIKEEIEKEFEKIHVARKVLGEYGL